MKAEVQFSSVTGPGPGTIAVTVPDGRCIVTMEAKVNKKDMALIEPKALPAFLANKVEQLFLAAFQQMNTQGVLTAGRIFG